MTDKQKKMSGLFVLIPLMIAGLTALFIFLAREAPHEMVMPPQRVILGAVESREITERWEYVGLVEADQIVDLRARVSGFLISKNFADGDLVKAGQLLFQIEPDHYQALVQSAEAGLLSAQAQYDRAKLDFTRTTDLYHKRTTPKSDYDRVKAEFEMAEAQVKSAQAALTQAQLNLQYSSVKAPFDGRVSDTPYSEGSLLGPESGVLAQVVSVDPILVTFGVSNRIITTSEEQNPEASLSSWHVRLRLGPDIYYPGLGRFTYVSPTVDPQTDTVKFKAKFDNPAKILRPNQIVTVIVERTRPEKKLLVPKEAVLTDVDGNYVLMPKTGPDGQGMTAVMRRVTIESGDTLDKEFVIKEGLAEDDRFIVKGLMSFGATLRPGSPVEVVEPAEEEAESPAREGGNS